MSTIAAVSGLTLRARVELWFDRRLVAGDRRVRDSGLIVTASAGPFGLKINRTARHPRLCGRNRV